MSLRKKGQYYYGDTQLDIREELTRFSHENAYAVDHWADAACACGARTFTLLVDDTEGAAVRICASCKAEHPIGDSEDYLEDAELEECECPCGAGTFEITVGVALYEGSEDVKWLYLGCRCVKCGLTACYGEWKNEYIGFREFLSRV